MTWISPLKASSSSTPTPAYSSSPTPWTPRWAPLCWPRSCAGLRVSAISPNYAFLFKDTPAALWLKRLLAGGVDPGEVPLGQNLSNLLRHAVLYKFGGVYLDADVIVLRSFSPLRNAIGAQAVDLATGNWSRLNTPSSRSSPSPSTGTNGVTTGRTWSLGLQRGWRVDPGSISPCCAGGLLPVRLEQDRIALRSPRSGEDRRRLSDKLRRLREASFALHLWNRHSKTMEVEEGSIVEQLMSDYCVFCNDSAIILLLSVIIGHQNAPWQWILSIHSACSS
ncbi:unnamed protein product [Spirodela intermedia]|uniref:Alpha 1,4-glycosyltransferase domain-containing protein n=1 Tax=Spirodela intermedia TaxID=51605 RepID=A0ABN7ED09_SPIIN|nr:unnamed protein product [Spirodela intermedia]